ncbi:hypothetical protein ACFFWE_34495 [Sphaerisporangium melleum]|nr:hypothetical protein [Sphaerisporangium melleum]
MPIDAPGRPRRRPQPTATAGEAVRPLFGMARAGVARVTVT